MSLQAKYEAIDSDSDLVCYSAEHISSIWPSVSKLIGVALDRGSDYRISEVFDGLINSTMQLWTSHTNGRIEAVLVTKIEEDYCLLLACAGENMREWSKYFTILEDWARSHGCKKLKIYGRRGWTKFGFDIEYTALSRPI